MSALRIVAYVAAGLIGLVVIGLVLVVVFVDPNDYRDDIEKLVEEKTGRELTLSGDLKLSVFPWIALESGPASLGDPLAGERQRHHDQHDAHGPDERARALQCGERRHAEQQHDQRQQRHEPPVVHPRGRTHPGEVLLARPSGQPEAPDDEDHRQDDDQQLGHRSPCLGSVEARPDDGATHHGRRRDRLRWCVRHRAPRRRSRRRPGR